MRIREGGIGMEQEKDWYRILEIPDNANEQEIKAAYRKLVKKYHPDTHARDKNNTEKFNDISEAYRILGNTEKRREYDKRRNKSTKSDFFQEHDETVEGNLGTLNFSSSLQTKLNSLILETKVFWEMVPLKLKFIVTKTSEDSVTCLGIP